MQISDVRRRIHETIERARRQAAERRTRTDEASRAFDAFLEATAVPLFRQVANVLKIEGYHFTVHTPAGSVRLASDRTGDDYIEIALDTSGDAPRVMGRTSHVRGRRKVDSERVVGSGEPESLTDEDVLTFVAKELEPFVER